MTARHHDYPDREALAEGLATGVAAILAGGIATQGQAVLCVSGGSTPKLFFEKLSQAAIDWAHVTVCLVDERFVPEHDERSNAGLVRQHLLRGPAAGARLQPLFAPAESAAHAARAVSPEIAALTSPFDVVVLGMGTDGHTASFFPGGDNLAQAIDPQTAEPVVAMTAEGAGEPRLTLTLPWLTQARFLALHIEGNEKRAVLAKAGEAGPVEDLPVRAVLRAERDEPLQIFWAP